MQEGHSIVYESRKFNDTERYHTVEEKEMTTIIHCLRVWRHYSLGTFFTIRIDNVATSYFQIQKKLSPKQAHWQDFLAEFHYWLEYKPRKTNIVANALSQKAELTLISQPKSSLLYCIKQGLPQDPLAKNITTLVNECKTRQFWLRGRLLYIMGDRLYMSKWDDLHKELIEECHNSKWVGHLGTRRMLALVEASY